MLRRRAARSRTSDARSASWSSSTLLVGASASRLAWVLLRRRLPASRRAASPAAFARLRHAGRRTSSASTSSTTSSSSARSAASRAACSTSSTASSSTRSLVDGTGVRRRRVRRGSRAVPERRRPALPGGVRDRRRAAGVLRHREPTLAVHRAEGHASTGRAVDVDARRRAATRRRGRSSTRSTSTATARPSRQGPRPASSATTTTRAGNYTIHVDGRSDPALGHRSTRVKREGRGASDGPRSRWITLLPLLGAGLVMLVPREEEAICTAASACVTSIVTFLVSLLILPRLRRRQGRLPARVRQGRGSRRSASTSTWHRRHLALAGPADHVPDAAHAARRRRRSIDKHVREFIVAMLVLETGMLGAFVALDLFLFYVFWELMLIPMYLIIGIWGGERRLYASIKFVIYTMVGSLLMLVAILYLYVAVPRSVTGSYTLRPRRRSRRCRCRTRAQMLVLRRVRARVRDQGAAVPAAHLVARRARRGADRRLGDPGRRAAQVRHLRLPALRDAAVPARRARAAAPLHRGAGGDRHHLRRARRVRAGRRQEAGRLLVGLAPRLRACSASSR